MPRPREVHPLLKELAKLREAAGLRQADVSRLLGYNPRTVSNWERGDRMPDLWDLSAYAQLLDREVILRRPELPVSVALPVRQPSDRDGSGMLELPRRLQVRTLSQAPAMPRERSVEPVAA